MLYVDTFWAIFSVGSTLLILWSLVHMNDALSALTDAVARIAQEVSETADAFREHINNPNGISADQLNSLTDRLNVAADALNALQAAPASDVPASDAPPPVPETPPIGESVPPVAPDNGTFGDEQPQPALAPTGDVPPAGNQNGVGSEFASGEPPASDVPPADDVQDVPPVDQPSATPIE